MSAPHLTSAERRGILSVAAAALICIGAGIAVRQCHSNYVQSLPPNQPAITILSDTISDTARSTDRTTTSDRNTTSDRRKGTKSKGRSTGKKKHPAKSTRKKTSTGTPTPRDFLNDTIPIR